MATGRRIAGVAVPEGPFVGIHQRQLEAFARRMLLAGGFIGCLNAIFQTAEAPPEPIFYWAVAGSLLSMTLGALRTPVAVSIGLGLVSSAVAELYRVPGYSNEHVSPLMMLICLISVELHRTRGLALVLAWCATLLAAAAVRFDFIGTVQVADDLGSAIVTYVVASVAVDVILAGARWLDEQNRRNLLTALHERVESEHLQGADGDNASTDARVVVAMRRLVRRAGDLSDAEVIEQGPGLVRDFEIELRQISDSVGASDELTAHRRRPDALTLQAAHASAHKLLDVARGRYSALFGPYLAVVTYFNIRYGWNSPDAALLITGGAISIATFWWLLVQLGRGPLSGRALVAVVTAHSVGLICTLAPLPAQYFLSPASWAVALSGHFAMILCFFLPTRWAWWVPLPGSLIVLWNVLADPQFPPWSATGAYTAAFVPAAFAFFLAWYWRKMQEQVHEDGQLIQQLSVKAVRYRLNQRFIGEVGSRWRAQWRQFGSAVRGDRLSAAELRATAQSLMSSLRDELTFGWQLDDALRARLEAVRESGVAVDCHAGGLRDESLDALCLRVLDRCLDFVVPGGQVAMRLPSGAGRPAYLRIEPPLSPDAWAYVLRPVPDSCVVTYVEGSEALHTDGGSDDQLGKVSGAQWHWRVRTRERAVDGYEAVRSTDASSASTRSVNIAAAEASKSATEESANR